MADRNPMRIAIASEKQTPSRGGAESWTYEFGKWLLDRDHDVHFVATRTAPDLDLPPSCVHTIERSRSCLGTAERLAAWLAQRRFDVIHDMGLGYSFDVFQPHCGSRLAHDRARDASSSAWRREWRRFKARWIKHDRLALSARQFSQRKGLYLAVSPKVAADLETLEEVDPKRIVTILNGVDTERFHPRIQGEWRDKTRRELGLADRDLMLLVVAHNYALKGVSLISQAVRSATHLPDSLRLVVVGGPRKHDWRPLGPHRVKFVGAVGHVRPYYAASDIYVHPTYYDACSLSLLEAMACGLPSITTPMNGASCFVRHGENGLILSKPEVPELIYLLDQLRFVPRRQLLAKAARQAAIAWNRNDNFQAIDSLYREIVGRRQAERFLSVHRAKAA